MEQSDNTTKDNVRQPDEIRGRGETMKEPYRAYGDESSGAPNKEVRRQASVGRGINWIGIYTMFRREVKRTFRVVTQTLIAPAISAALYIFIFGSVIGSRISDFAGVPYITFVFPGVLMLSVVNSSFASASSALYFMRFSKSIEEMLITPFSYFEMLLGLVGSSIVRTLLVSFLILAVGVGFGAVRLQSPLAFVFYVMAIAAIFAMLGIIVALWAESFEQLQVLNTFVITPLTYLGGIFYSITFLPPAAAMITRFNPFFYFIDGIRGSMIGYHEANSQLGLIVIVGLVVGLGTLVTQLFKRGWKIRF